jgi:2-polyprenyl-3-methyl-5-hydroxy-6-metoxy-1,4-benzoquinol methylase
MAYDPVRAVQVSVRRGSKFLRRKGVVAEFDDERQHLEGEKRDRFFDKGIKQVEGLAENIEAYTGRSLDGRTVLDYGCGVGRLVIPLSRRCEHVFGVDINPALLAAGERYAAEESVTNVDWLLIDRLPELSGRYDAVLSYWVFQHIPPREGEEIFAELLRGLRPDGVGAIHFTVPPRYSMRELVGRVDLWYQLMNSYSLNRLGRVLAQQGITEWHLRWHAPKKDYQSVTIFFHKDDDRS